tara:strand:+ start:6539 stop:6862 length:324 start_codon:yes stop_codon:yes gene_type:complete
MASVEWMTEEVLKIVPDAIVEVSDLHGTGDHFHVRVISETFEGVRPLQRQKPILNHFKEHIAKNTVHALDLRCMTPKQAEESGKTAFDPHGQEQGFFGVHIRRTKGE